jgi:hypothetical protein
MELSDTPEKIPSDWESIPGPSDSNCHKEHLNWNLELMFVDHNVHHSKIHKEKSNKMQNYIQILLFQVYMKLDMFRATHRPSLGG